VKLRLTVTLLTVSRTLCTVTRLPRKIILALLLSGGGAGVAHYSIDESRSWPASKKHKKMTDYFKI
jgi:hypothetical protein